METTNNDQPFQNTENMNTSLQNLKDGRNEEQELRDKIFDRQKNYHGKYFIMIVCIATAIVYYIYLVHTVFPNRNNLSVKTLLLFVLFFHILLFLMLWAYLITMKTEPGRVPLYWGFYSGDDPGKRRRYCLICNAFKPERCHHCSICNVCILNLDHHCPWIDNCIGFYNKKFFMQLLFYLSLLLIYLDVTTAYLIFTFFFEIEEDEWTFFYRLSSVLMIGMFGFLIIFSCVILIFFKFHIKMVAINSNTLENIDKENEAENMKYRLSFYENWTQVFGLNKLFWFLPIPNEEGRPNGDGLVWQTNEKI